MFLKFSIYKIEGDSMSPSLNKNTFVLMKPFKKKEINKFFIFKHETYGKLVKKLVKIDSSNNFWFEGEHQSSISKTQVGPIKECNILGQIVFSISKSSIKFHL